MVADAAHDVAEVTHVVAGERVEEQAAADLDVPGQDAAEEIKAGAGDGDQGGAVVVRTGAADGEAGLFQQAGLVGQAAAAVDDAVGQLGHGQRAVRAGETSQQLELDVADVTLGAQLLLDLVLEQADSFHEHEVGTQLLRAERVAIPGSGAGARLAVAHGPTLPAANSKHCEKHHLARQCCFEIEAVMVFYVLQLRSSKGGRVMKAVRYHSYGD